MGADEIDQMALQLTVGLGNLTQGRLGLVRGQEAKVETQVGIQDGITPGAAGLALGDRQSAGDIAGLDQVAQVLRQVHVGDAGEALDVFGRGAPVGNGAQDGNVVVRIRDEVLQQQARLAFHQVAGREQGLLDVFSQGFGWIQQAPVLGDAAEDGIGGDPLGGRVGWKVLGGQTKGQGLQVQRCGGAPVERHLVREVGMRKVAVPSSPSA